MTSGAAGSKPSPISGKPDVTIMIHRIWTGANGKTDNPLLSLKARPMSKVHA